MEVFSGTRKAERSSMLTLLNRILKADERDTKKVCLFCLKPIDRSHMDYLCELCRLSVDLYIDDCYEGKISRQGYKEAATLNLNAADYYAMRLIRRADKYYRYPYYTFLQLGTIIAFNNKTHLIKCRSCGEFYFVADEKQFYCQDCRKEIKPPNTSIVLGSSCKQCGNKFYHLRRNRYFCSKSCYSESVNKNGGRAQCQK